MDDVNRKIWEKFHIHRGDTLPFVGFINYTRYDVAALFGELGYKVGAELGVKMGSFSRAIIDANPGVKLYCIDTWKAYSRTVNDARAEQHFERAKRKLAGFDVTFLRKTGMEALNDIPDKSLDFIYIDALHDFDNVMVDIIHWSKKVRSGGIVSGHDYFHFYEGGVVLAVDTYTRAHNINMWYVTKGELEPSWYWVNP
jgi:hypothetical protein